MRTRRKTGRDQHAETELMLYAENTGELHRQKDAFLANMHAKMRRGTYSPEKGRKLWMYFVDRAAKAYAKEFGGVWNKNFPKSVREKVAADLEKQERREIESGAYDKYPPGPFESQFGRKFPTSRDPRRRTRRSVSGAPRPLPYSAGPWFDVKMTTAGAARKLAKSIVKRFGYRAYAHGEVVTTNAQRWEVYEANGTARTILHFDPAANAEVKPMRDLEHRAATTRKRRTRRSVSRTSSYFHSRHRTLVSRKIRAKT